MWEVEANQLAGAWKPTADYPKPARVAGLQLWTTRTFPSGQVLVNGQRHPPAPADKGFGPRMWTKASPAPTDKGFGLRMWTMAPPAPRTKAPPASADMSFGSRPKSKAPALFPDHAHPDGNIQPTGMLHLRVQPTGRWLRFSSLLPDQRG